MGGHTPQREKDQITIGLFNEAISEQQNRTLPLESASELNLIDIEINPEVRAKPKLTLTTIEDQGAQ